MISKSRLFLGALLLCLGGTALAGNASVAVSVDTDHPGGVASTVSVTSAASVAGGDDDAQADGAPKHHTFRLHGRIGSNGDHTLLSIGHNQSLAAGQHADNVIGILGNSSVAGDVSEDVVSVLGNLRVTGPVDGDVVAVLGNTYIDSKVDGDVVAVLGNVQLGPNAEVGGDLNSVGGKVTRDGAKADLDSVGGTQLDFSDVGGVDFTWLHDWITQCFLKGRLLAFGHGFAWAWIVALVSLAFYVLTAAMLRDPVRRYTRVLEEHPAESLFAGFLALLATPVLGVLLCITVIGIIAIPFLGIALLLAASFGKTVVLAWIGGRLLRPAADGTLSHPALAVLVGGLIVTVLYAIPVVGMLTHQVTGLIGIGVAVYGLLLALRQKRQLAAAPAPAPTPPPAPASAAAAASLGESPAPAPDAVAAAAAAASAAVLMPGAAPAPGPGPAAGAASAAAAVSAGTATVNAATAATYPRAGFWIRMFALFIDLVIVGIVAGLLLDSSKSHLLLLAAYGAVMWKLKGATLGDMICHLHVVRLDGRMLDWPTAAIRALSCFLSLFVVFLGFIWIAVDPERQAWHDKIAGTVVVRLPKGVSLI